MKKQISTIIFLFIIQITMFADGLYPIILHSLDINQINVLKERINSHSIDNITINYIDNLTLSTEVVAILLGINSFVPIIIQKSVLQDTEEVKYDHQQVTLLVTTFRTLCTKSIPPKCVTGKHEVRTTPSLKNLGDITLHSSDLTTINNITEKLKNNNMFKYVTISYDNNHDLATKILNNLLALNSDARIMVQRISQTVDSDRDQVVVRMNDKFWWQY